MNCIKVKTYEEMSRIAANIILEQIKNKPDSVLGLATGSTPIGLYDCLVSAYADGIADFSRVKSVNLDEYCGLSGDNVQSYRYFMNTHLFDKINIDKANTFVPDGTNDDPEGECKRYDNIIESLGGIDIQVLGIGNNGHIGFNEPADAFSDSTHVVSLAKSTIEANSRFFEKPEDVPTKALTMGIGSIMKSRKIILIANGDKKKDIVEKALNSEITPLVPASILKKHPDLTVIFSEK